MPEPFHSLEEVWNVLKTDPAFPKGPTVDDLCD